MNYGSNGGGYNGAPHGGPGGFGPPPSFSSPPSGNGGGSGPPFPPNYYDSYKHNQHKTKVFTMKPSLSYFPTLTDESKYPVWRRKFQSMCNGTNLGEVLLLTYRPNEEDLESFHKCMWVCTVLEHTVHTTEGQNILEKHRTRSDGRAVLPDLDAHGRTSTASQLQA